MNNEDDEPEDLKTITKDGCIHVLVEGTRIKVKRLTKHQRETCNHAWKPVSAPGHGRWVSGCFKCGALSRLVNPSVIDNRRTS